MKMRATPNQGNRKTTRLPDVLTFRSCQALTGINYGIQFEGRPDIYVSPAIASLAETDPEAVLKSLRVKEIKSDDTENPLRKILLRPNQRRGTSL